ncbi:MAG: hypothetical protein P4L16_07235 [Chlamydiales bacterium]|nr:hypothetical protein [Chlamydiales bacterium]
MKKETNPKKTISSKKQPKALKKGSLKKTSGGENWDALLPGSSSPSSSGLPSVGEVNF